ncbi:MULTISPECIES: NHL domain-containing protein [unclassified Nitrospina]|uniref:NHL domain-containing protein n=1 Tax=unclassified Nitrospina TaxID=2638683 RepID=UPI003F95D161
MTPTLRTAFYAGLCLLAAVFLIPPAGEAKIGKPRKATNVSISLVDGIAVAPNGDVYISRRSHNIVSKIDQNGTLTNVVGTGVSGYSGDGGPATAATLKVPAGLTFDKEGNLYIADRENHVVRKVDANGIITTFAGTGEAGYSGDNGPATKAALNLPSDMTVDHNGNLFISDRSNNVIRKVDRNGTITTYAGTGNEGYNGDNMPALRTNLDKPFGLAVDKQGNLYIADRGNNRVRKVDADSGLMSTIGGDGGFFFIGDNGPAYRASIAGPTDVAVDDEGNVYVADRNNNRIRKINTLGMIRTVMGTGQQDYNGDAEVARETNLHLPFALTLDNNGDLLVVDRSHYRIRKMYQKGSRVETIAGNGVKNFAGDNGPATGANLEFPHGIVVDKHDNVIFADKGHYRIRQVDPEGVISTIVGNGIRGNIGDNGPALEASVFPTILELNHKDEIFFLSPSGFVSLIRKVDNNGIISLLISTGDQDYQKAVMQAGYTGRSSHSEITIITQFSGLAFDKEGNLYVSDRINHQIRKVTPEGKIITIAGNGNSDYTGDNGPAKHASFRDPQSLTMDKEGNLYIGDTANNVIRKIDKNGIVTTYAGNGNHEYSGDGGPALEAGFKSIGDIVFSPSGELHVVETGNHTVRKITRDGKVERVAGRAGVQGLFGDGGKATEAMLKQPACIAFDSKGNLYITDMGNNRIRKVDTNGIITTLAGRGSFGWGYEGEEVNIYFQNFP